jgi:hypothetical protein
VERQKTNDPYISIAKGIDIDHPDLELGIRTRFKIMRIKADADIPIDTIYKVFNLAKKLYK